MNIRLVLCMLVTIFFCSCQNPYDEIKEEKAKRETAESTVYSLTVVVSIIAIGSIILFVAGAAMGSNARKAAEKKKDEE